MTNIADHQGELPVPKFPKELSEEAMAIFNLRVKRGMVAGEPPTNEERSKTQQTRMRKKHHNTKLLLHSYRDIVWAMECYPRFLEEELDLPMHDLDSLLSLVDVEVNVLNNQRLENRLRSLQHSRQLLDRINEAVSFMRTKPKTGERLYQLIYETYINPEKASMTSILDKLELSSRHYYRLREQAFHVLSIRLWSVPTQDMEAWLDVLTLLEHS